MSEAVVHRLEFTGMTCGSCERIMERIAERNGARVNEIDADSGLVSLTCAPEKLSPILEEFARNGFRKKGSVEEPRGNPRRVLDYLGALVSAAEHVQAESILFNYSLAGLMASTLALLVSYFLFFNGVPDVLAYFPFWVLAVLTSVSSVYSYYNAKCYSNGISCTNGMMVGMIMGMIPGFMAGAIAGATNGMFVGSLAGMALGIILGVKAGKTCGIMGAMEGAMAGLMAGIMGAMTSVMMLNDHLVAFLFILFALCGALLLGMSYLLHREEGQRDQTHVSVGLPRFALLCVGLSLLLVVLMVYGPKGPLTFI
ncbi:MAG: hypothetical protein HY917_01840 [Candidatus Diapherotrites archaeon]|nr:hypothetical protein [Candidatus Diapherotrites archaeon]